MSDIFLNDKEIEEIFKAHLKVDSKVVSIETMFTNLRRQPKYDPYYQRNYVWDNDKATYFIESILLGTEIPPLVLFNSSGYIEVIDGRQRYETIKRFLGQEFSLTDKGLHALKDLRKSGFEDLSETIRDLFWDTKLRILEFSVVNEPRLDARKEDLIKKEIFRRYNSGITPLRTEEIDKAVYITDDTTGYFKHRLKSNLDEYRLILELFFSEREIELKDKPLTIEKVMEKVRTFLVLHRVPINYYSTGQGTKDAIAQFFEHLSNNTENKESLYDNFYKKVRMLKVIRDCLSDRGVTINRLVFECLFWCLSICEAEGVIERLTGNERFIEDIVGYIAQNIDKYRMESSHFYKYVNERYTYTSKFFEETLGLNFDLYLTNKGRVRGELEKLTNPRPSDSLSNFESLRLNKPDASTTTIEDICRQMLRGRFLVRPPYQRGEAINRIKSSALIESILLGIKLPPIFVYKREDGISEVVDGQQRLLTILGYIGQDFIDENNERVKSEKNEFALSKLPLMRELNGRKFRDLPEDLRNKIYDFDISVVNIDAKLNPHFDPIDLFIRLNNKPYPIRENTFEMWNSYVDMEVISSIKENTKKHADWFYSRINNSRMENEELYTLLAYLEYKKLESGKKVTSDYLDIYQRGERINSRVKDKSDVTKVLNVASTDEDMRVQFLKCIKGVESFVRKVRIVLIDRDLLEEETKFLLLELESIFNPVRPAPRRTFHNFYILWFVLGAINLEMVRVNRLVIKDDLRDIYAYITNVPLGDGKGLEGFHHIVSEFWSKYAVPVRSISLSESEKRELIKKQGNICPLCGGPLFAGDDVEVDHIKPIAVGGRDAFLNLQLTHRDCNRKKGAVIG